MDRRKALKNLGILSGGVMLFPSCDFSKEQISLALNNLQVTESQEALVKNIVSTLIPEGELPGAGSLDIDDFVWVMVDDCLEEATQQSYVNGLQNFDHKIQDLAGSSFVSLSSEARIAAMENILGGKKDGADREELDLINFLEITKQFSIWGYMTSKHIMTEVMPYTLIPGTYGPCETIDKSKRINLYG